MVAGLRVGVNGFGRVGRAVTRVLLARGRHRVVHVNDVHAEVANLAYLLRYDSTYGRLAGRVSAGDGEIVVDAGPIGVTGRADVAEVDWQARGVDVVVEASGAEANERHARGLLDAVRAVIVTHACEADHTLVFGVNEADFDPRRQRKISTSICDAVAVAPIIKWVDEEVGVEAGMVTTLHPWLASQNLLDGPPRGPAYEGSADGHYALGRAAAGALIAKPTTLVRALEQVLPRVAGALQAMSYRAPTACVASADLTLALAREVRGEELLALLRARAAVGSPVVRFTDEPLISVDHLGDPHSCIVDTRWAMVGRGGRIIKIVVWYDNEWGYASRVADAIDRVAEGG